MVFGQEQLIDENTPEGGYFKDTFIMLWNEGKSAKEIAEELQFFEQPNNPWDNRLKLHHVYYFARKWELPPRKKNKSRVPKGYVKYTPNMPPAIVASARKEGRLWNDPLEKG